MKRTPAYQTTDGQLFASREEAQKHEIENAFAPERWTIEGLDKDQMIAIQVTAAQIAWAQRDILLTALSTRKPRTPKAKPAKSTKRATATEPTPKP